MSNVSKNITVEAKLISPHTYTFVQYVHSMYCLRTRSSVPHTSVIVINIHKIDSTHFRCFLIVILCFEMRGYQCRVAADLTAVFAGVICALFSILAAEKSGCVKYADFFCGGLDLGFILV